MCLVEVSMWSLFLEEICSWRLHSQVENWEDEHLTGPACFPFILMESMRAQDRRKESGGEWHMKARVYKQSWKMLNNERQGWPMGSTAQEVSLAKVKTLDSWFICHACLSQVVHLIFQGDLKIS